MLRLAYAEAYAREFVRAQVGYDALEPVVPARAAALADAHAAGREGHLIRDYDYMLRRHLVEPGGLAHGLAGEVHVRLRLHEQHAVAGYVGPGRQGAVAHAVHPDA